MVKFNNVFALIGAITSAVDSIPVTEKPKKCGALMYTSRDWGCRGACNERAPDPSPRRVTVTAHPNKGTTLPPDLHLGTPIENPPISCSF